MSSRGSVAACTSGAGAGAAVDEAEGARHASTTSIREASDAAVRRDTTPPVESWILDSAGSGERLTDDDRPRCPPWFPPCGSLHVVPFIDVALPPLPHGDGRSGHAAA